MLSSEQPWIFNVPSSLTRYIPKNLSFTVNDHLQQALQWWIPSPSPSMLGSANKVVSSNRRDPICLLTDFGPVMELAYLSPMSLPGAAADPPPKYSVRLVELHQPMLAIRITFTSVG